MFKLCWPKNTKQKKKKKKKFMLQYCQDNISNGNASSNHKQKHPELEYSVITHSQKGNFENCLLNKKYIH